MKTAVLSLLLILGALPLSAQTWQRLGPEGGMVISLAADQAGSSTWARVTATFFRARIAASAGNCAAAWGGEQTA